MHADRITGKAKQTFGKLEAGVGDAVGDQQTQASGRARQAAGIAQEGFGSAKDVMGDMASAASDAAGPMAETLAGRVKANPLIAVAIAALIGYVVALLTSG